VLRKFLDGLAFGAGLAIALVAVWTIAMYFVIPRVIHSVTTETKVPKFENPTDARIAEPDPSAAKKDREFSFFRHSEDRMKMPQGGGILALATISTPAGEKRPRTYQLWLTQTGLWQIRTTEHKAQIEQLPRPESATVLDIDRLMVEKVGPMARKGTMTVSDVDIQQLRSSGASQRDDTLNGRLSITVDGVVFVLPNPYGT
jgi:hypothetical protein